MSSRLIILATDLIICKKILEYVKITNSIMINYLMVFLEYTKEYFEHFYGHFTEGL